MSAIRYIQIYYIIALSLAHPDSPMFWCGYVSQGKTHSWRRGTAGAKSAIRFLRREDAINAGVSGPNIPHVPAEGQPQHWADRGVRVLEYSEDPQLELPVDTTENIR